jgi:hypothetical protein
MRQDGFLYVIAILASVLLSLWINTHESVINVDAICYILSAEALSHADLSSAMHVCPQAKWPFYSVLIFAISSITKLSYIVSAYLIDAIFSALSVVTFIAIIKRLGGSRRVMWFALATILLSHQFNSVRQYIVRDHGFWAFYLVSIYFLLQYTEKLNWKNALAWSVSLLAATLFRIEGAMFLLMLPFAAFFFPATHVKQRLSRFFTLNALTLCLLVLIPLVSLDKLDRVHEVINQFQHGIALISERYHDTTKALVTHVLPFEAARDVGIVFVLMLSVWYIINVLSNLSWIYSALVLYAWSTRAALLKRSALIVLVAYLIVNLCITTSFFAQHLFFAKRYLIAFSLVFMLWVPFALDRLWLQATAERARAGFAIATTAIFISALGGIFSFGYSKSYIHEAGTWIVQHVPERASIYINDYQLMYYAERYRQDFFNTISRYTHSDTLSQGQWQQYDYIALRIGKHDHEKFLLEAKLTPVKEFANERGDKVVIYHIANKQEIVR